MRITAAGVLGVVVLVAASGAARAEDFRRAQLHAVMNSVFGAGTWRETGGYRTPERENQLRAEGALTVPEGSLSRHSIGQPDAPGAYDVVVAGLTPSQAAERLRMAGVSFRTLLPEGAHGTQGPHLHLEPHGFGQTPGRRGAPRFNWTVAETSAADAELNLLQARGEQGDADAQLRLGQALASGRNVRTDLIAAYAWTALAASNPVAEPVIRREAEESLDQLTRRMTKDDRLHAQAIARSSKGSAACESDSLYTAVPIYISGQTDGPGITADCAGAGPVAAAPDPRALASR